MYVTLSINNRSIKLLSVMGRQVKKWGNLALSSGLVRDGLILQPQAVGEAIATLCKSTGVTKDKVIISLAGLSFTYRFLSLPRMKPALLDEALLRAARKEISLSLDELYLSWQLLPGKGDEQSYFVVGVPRNLIDALVETLKIAGIEPYLMDLQSLALARAANRKDAIIVNMETDCFDIVFIANGIPTVIHTVNPRSEGATLEDNIRRLVEELTKTATFYQSRHPESPLSSSTPLLLTGELAIESPASGLLQSEIEYTVESLVPQLQSPPDLPVNSYIVNIGLALKRIPTKTAAKDEGSLFYDININLLSGKYRRVRKKPKPAGYFMLWTFLAIAIVLLFPLYQSRNRLIAENTRQQTEFNNISRELNLASLISEVNAQTDNTIQQMIINTETLKATNQSILSVRGNFSRDLQSVTEVLPPFTYFISIGIDNKLVTIHGETDNVYAVVKYATNLELNDLFSEVRITELDEAISKIKGDNETMAEPTEFLVTTFGIAINK